MSVTERVGDLVEPLAGSLGLSIYDIEQAGPILRISVEGPDGVGTAALTRLTRMISSALDEADPVPGSYTLEVTSPGLERRLRTLDHYAGAVGTRVKIKTLPDVEPRRIEGELTGVDEPSRTVTIVDESGTENVLAVDEIQTTRTIFEWGPAPKPGGKTSKKTKSNKPKPKSSKSGSKGSTRSHASRSAGRSRG